MHQALSSIPALHKLCAVTLTSHPGTKELEAGGQEFKVILYNTSELEESLDYIRPCLYKTTNQKAPKQVQDLMYTRQIFYRLTYILSPQTQSFRFCFISFMYWFYV